ncbi:MAG: hypothetical protein R3F55_10490 [Alphaproteobacteria bacterium]
MDGNLYPAASSVPDRGDLPVHVPHCPPNREHTMDLRHRAGLAGLILPVLVATALAACVPVGRAAGPGPFLPGTPSTGAPSAGGGAPGFAGPDRQRFIDPRAGGVWLDGCYTAGDCDNDENFHAFCREQGYTVAVWGESQPIDVGTYRYGDGSICTGQSGEPCQRVTFVDCAR